MVRRSLWGSERFISVPDDPARYLYLYLLTCPHQTSSGCFVLKEAYALADLDMAGADWTAAKYRKAKAALITSGLIMADDATGEILITRWWKDNSPNNESWFGGARKQCEAISSGDLRIAALEALEACWAGFNAGRSQAAATSLSHRMTPGVPRRRKAARHRQPTGCPGMSTTASPHPVPTLPRDYGHTNTETNT
jgi:hypothetical protein